MPTWLSRLFTHDFLCKCGDARLSSAHLGRLTTVINTIFTGILSHETLSGSSECTICERSDLWWFDCLVYYKAVPMDGLELSDSSRHSSALHHCGTGAKDNRKSPSSDTGQSWENPQGRKMQSANVIELQMITNYRHVSNAVMLAPTVTDSGHSAIRRSALLTSVTDAQVHTRY